MPRRRRPCDYRRKVFRARGHLSHFADLRTTAWTTGLPFAARRYSLEIDRIFSRLRVLLAADPAALAALESEYRVELLARRIGAPERKAGEVITARHTRKREGEIQPVVVRGPND